VKKILSLILAMLALQACANQPASSQSASDTAAATATVANAYLDYSGRDDVFTAAVAEDCDLPPACLEQE